MCFWNLSKFHGASVNAMHRIVVTFYLLNLSYMIHKYTHRVIHVFENGIVYSVGCSLEKALKEDRCRIGDAEKVVTVTYNFDKC